MVAVIGLGSIAFLLCIILLVRGSIREYSCAASEKERN